MFIIFGTRKIPFLLLYTNNFLPKIDKLNFIQERIEREAGSAANVKSIFRIMGMRMKIYSWDTDSKPP